MGHKSMKRGLPVVVPPEPALMLGQMRTAKPELPVQLAENVAVVSIVVFWVRLTVPKLRLVIVKLQFRAAACAGTGQAIAAANTAATQQATLRYMIPRRTLERTDCRGVVSK
jgi:hypothetical protein